MIFVRGVRPRAPRGSGANEGVCRPPKLYQRMRPFGSKCEEVVL